MKRLNLLMLGLLVTLTGCASRTDYFYPNTGLQSEEIEKMRYAEVIELGEKAYQDGFYRESSRLFMTARHMSKKQNIVDESILEANSQKEFQATFKQRELSLQNAIARYGDTHAEVADKEFWLAKSYDSIGQPDQAAIHFQRAIDIGEIVLAPGDTSLETYYRMMGHLMHDVGQHARSLTYYDKAFNGGDVDSSSPHPKARSAIHFNYGSAYKALGQRAKAYESMHNAWSECQKYMYQDGADKVFCNKINILREGLKD